MIEHIKIADMSHYPDLYVTRKTLVRMVKQGLIEPIIINKALKVHPRWRERFEAFRRVAIIHGDAGAETIIAVYYETLDKDEIRDVGKWIY